MSKSSKKSVKQQFLSPDNYICTKARNLPVAECFMTSEWQGCGECNIIIARQHTNGNYTFGIYLVDTYCLGIKESFYNFNVPTEEFKEIKKNFEGNLVPATYDEAHNIIYGALAYAEELGFRPDKNFALTQYILEEDDEKIPLIEYEFGCNGKPFLVVDTQTEYNRYAPTLEKSTGGNFEYAIGGIKGGDDDFDDVRDDEMRKLFGNLSEEERDVFLERMEDLTKRLEASKALPHVTYNYQHPDYPQSLELVYNELQALFLPENKEKLNNALIDDILSLPRESLIKDLNNCILYEIGQNCKGISGKNEAENSYGCLMHALWLLAELNAEESLPVVLEILRQDDDFYDFFFGDFAVEIISPVLYKLGHNRLPALLSFAKEPSLHTYFKTLVSSAVATIVFQTPKRRAEIIEWYGELLDFCYDNINDVEFYDAAFVGMLMYELLDIRAKELLPKIKRLYDTGLVDEMSCGNYSDIEKEMDEHKLIDKDRYKVKSIYDFYKDMNT